MRTSEKKPVKTKPISDRKQMITFRLAWEGPEETSVLLYRKGSEEVLGEEPLREHPYDGCIRSAEVSLDPKRTEYNFRIGDRIVQDPAAGVITGRGSFGDMTEKPPHQVRCGFVSEEFDWEGETPLRIPYEDVVAYCLHVRGFTMNAQSKVRHKGTFLGIKEKIPYIKDLGINQVILMPAYEFNEVMTRPSAGQAMSMQNKTGNVQNGALQAGGMGKQLNYWGYTDGFFYAPKASYCATKKPDLEFKEMVHAMHQAGIELIMEFAFPDRMDICLMLDCLTWWIREYHVDGFLLMINQEKAVQLSGCPQLKEVKLITGYFPPSAVYPEGRKNMQRVLASCNNGFKEDCRRLLKGDEGQLEVFVGRVRQNDPDVACINYITNHDGFTLMDLVSYDKKHNEENGEDGRDGAPCDFSWNCGTEGPSRKTSILSLRLQQMKNAFAMLLLSQGTPMILAGDEFANTQGGNNNPWCIDSEVTWLDWGRSRMSRELTSFVRELIALRRAYPILHPARPLAGADTTSCGYPDFSCHSGRAWYGGFEYQDRHVGMMYCTQEKKAKEFVYTAYNLHWDSHTFAMPYLPEGMKWKCVLDSSGALPEEIEQDCPVRECIVPGRTVRVYTGAEAEKEETEAAETAAEAGKNTED